MRKINPKSTQKILCMALWLSANAMLAQSIKPSQTYNITPQRLSNAVSEQCQLPMPKDAIKQDDQVLSFEGFAQDDGQVDPQIAVGNNQIVHISNTGIAQYQKDGKLLQAQYLGCFGKIKHSACDPKLYFDPVQKYFAFGLWDVGRIDKKSHMKFVIGQDKNGQLSSWSDYSVPIPDVYDGGSLGYGKDWVMIKYDAAKGDNYSGPILLASIQQLRQHLPAKFYKFPGHFGQPVFNQNNGESYIITIDEEAKKATLHQVALENGAPVLKVKWAVANPSKYEGMPPMAEQKSEKRRISSGDYNPKNAVIQGNSLWYCHAVNHQNYAAIEWFELSLSDGQTIQKGLLQKNNSYYMQPTIAVNQRGDMAIGFQECNSQMYVSPRLAYRLANDAAGATRPVIAVAEGNWAYKNPDSTDQQQAWGDYSGSMVDGDNGIDFWFSQTYAKDKTVKTKLFKLDLSSQSTKP
jgi:hypothetical protein